MQKLSEMSPFDSLSDIVERKIKFSDYGGCLNTTTRGIQYRHRWQYRTDDSSHKKACMSDEKCKHLHKFKTAVCIAFETKGL
jgi:hypothetical protein